MAAQHYTLALTTSTPIKLSSVIPAGTVIPSCRFLSLQAHSANAAVIYVGGFNQKLSSTEYGWRIEVPVSTIPAAPSIIEFGGGTVVSLSDLQVLGTTNDELQIFFIS
jgi:hypothetical protein